MILRTPRAALWHYAPYHRCFSLFVRQFVIADEHLAIPQLGAAVCRVDDLDWPNPPASKQLSHFGMIIQGKQKPAADFVQALFKLGKVLIAEIVAVKLPPPVRRVHIEAGCGAVVLAAEALPLQFQR